MTNRTPAAFLMPLTRPSLSSQGSSRSSGSRLSTISPDFNDHQPSIGTPTRVPFGSPGQHSHNSNRAINLSVSQETGYPPPRIPPSPTTQAPSPPLSYTLTPPEPDSSPSFSLQENTNSYSQTSNVQTSNVHTSNISDDTKTLIKNFMHRIKGFKIGYKLCSNSEAVQVFDRLTLAIGSTLSNKKLNSKTKEKHVEIIIGYLDKYLDKKEKIETSCNELELDIDKILKIEEGFEYSRDELSLIRKEISEIKLQNKSFFYLETSKISDIQSRLSLLKTHINNIKHRSIKIDPENLSADTLIEKANGIKKFMRSFYEKNKGKNIPDMENYFSKMNQYLDKTISDSLDKEGPKFQVIDEALSKCQKNIDHFLNRANNVHLTLQTTTNTASRIKKDTQALIKLLSRNNFLKQHPDLAKKLAYLQKEIQSNETLLRKMPKNTNQNSEQMKLARLKTAQLEHYLYSLSGPLFDRPTFRDSSGEKEDKVLIISEPKQFSKRTPIKQFVKPTPIMVSRNDFATKTFRDRHYQTDTELGMHIKIHKGGRTTNKNGIHLFKYKGKTFNLNKLWPENDIKIPQSTKRDLDFAYAGYFKTYGPKVTTEEGTAQTLTFENAPLVKDEYQLQLIRDDNRDLPETGSNEIAMKKSPDNKLLIRIFEIDGERKDCEIDYENISDDDLKQAINAKFNSENIAGENAIGDGKFTRKILSFLKHRTKSEVKRMKVLKMGPVKYSIELKKISERKNLNFLEKIFGFANFREYFPFLRE